jgi:hypothetical protein
VIGPVVPVTATAVTSGAVAPLAPNTQILLIPPIPSEQPKSTPEDI